LYRLVKLHVGAILAEISPYFDRERVGEGAKPLVLVCMVSKTMCGYDRCVAPSAQLQVNRQYLGDVDFESATLRESIAETLSTFTISPSKARDVVAMRKS
jgi:hypothetical protein